MAETKLETQEQDERVLNESGVVVRGTAPLATTTPSPVAVVEPAKPEPTKEDVIAGIDAEIDAIENREKRSGFNPWLGLGAVGALIAGLYTSFHPLHWPTTFVLTIAATMIIDVAVTLRRRAFAVSPDQKGPRFSTLREAHACTTACTAFVAVRSAIFLTALVFASSTLGWLGIIAPICFFTFYSIAPLMRAYAMRSFGDTLVPISGSKRVSRKAPETPQQQMVRLQLAAMTWTLFVLNYLSIACLLAVAFGRGHVTVEEIKFACGAAVALVLMHAIADTPPHNRTAEVLRTLRREVSLGLTPPADARNKLEILTLGMHTAMLVERHAAPLISGLGAVQISLRQHLDETDRIEGAIAESLKIKSAEPLRALLVEVQTREVTHHALVESKVTPYVAGFFGAVTAVRVAGEEHIANELKARYEREMAAIKTLNDSITKHVTAIRASYETSKHARPLPPPLTKKERQKLKRKRKREREKAAKHRR